MSSLRAADGESGGFWETEEQLRLQHERDGVLCPGWRFIIISFGGFFGLVDVFVCDAASPWVRVSERACADLKRVPVPV